MKNLKVLLLNGSPRPNGNTAVALKEMEKVFNENGVETEIVNVGNREVRGCSATFDELNKYFTISGMPVASSTYWNCIHGRTPGEAEQDGEGLFTMRSLARNMTFLMKSVALGKEQFGLPEKEKRVATNFIR